MHTMFYLVVYLCLTVHTMLYLVVYLGIDSGNCFKVLMKHWIGVIHPRHHIFGNRKYSRPLGEAAFVQQIKIHG